MTVKLMPDYGQDAPGLRRGMLIAGIAGVLLCFAAMVILQTGWFRAGLFIVGLPVAAYGLCMAAYMTWGSRVGKLRTRDRLLDQAGQILGLKGNENVLDVGCGRGLLLIGAAKRLTTGVATGIDIWSNEDQSANSPEAAAENARREGVSEKVRIDTGDARSLPYPDKSMDLVLSHWVVHNLKDEPDRMKALDEMWRVTRPGGVIALADIEHVAAYQAHFLKLGAQQVVFDDGGWQALIAGWVSGGSFKPQTLIVKR